MMFRGHLIRALYHACAGGHTENAENVYSSAIAYLRGVSSPGEEEYPQYSYTTEIPMAAIQEALADRFYALEVRDRTRMAEDLWRRAEEDSLRGLFLRELRTKWSAAQTEEERETVTQAARFGLAALDHRDLN